MFSTRMPVAALVAAASLSLAACGGGSSSGEADGRVTALAAKSTPDTSNGKLVMKVLSSRPEYVTGGDARIQVTADPGLHDKLVFWLNGTQIAPTMTSSGDKLEGVVSGLVLGDNRLEVRHRNGQGLGVSGAIQLVNHPIAGPVFSGPHLAPFECRTVQSNLGAPLDADCSVATRYNHFYLTTAGKLAVLSNPTGPRPADLATTTTSEGLTVPFIVRVESATINRSIVRIAVLDDPQVAGQWNGVGWNKRLVFTIGESTGAQYNQGVNQVTDVLGNTAAQLGLAKGFGLVISTQAVNKLNPNDVLTAEGMMMVKEHFIEAYGVPRWMVGYGGSGGAIEQLLIAQNYPGLMDGIIPNAAFPDVLGTAQAVTDCRLLNRYFTTNPASAPVRNAFEGFASGTCANWDAGNGDSIVADGGPGGGCGLLDKSLVYNPVTNPSGARCTIQDVNANSLGRDPATGFARRPLDNVGIQYGLLGLRQGRITTTQFLDLNERIGGFDIDGNLIAQRTAGDLIGLRNAYENGRIGSGAGGLATVPIMHARVWAEIAGDIHTAYNDVQIREKLLKASGRADNQVVWVLPHPQLPLFQGGNAADVARLTALVNAVVAQQFALMVQWLDAISADPAPLTIDKIVAYKPTSATDTCWALDGTRIAEPPTLFGGACNALYPKGVSPRLMAGAPVTDDVLKCQLKPIADAEYLPAAFNAAEKARLAGIFPSGVCDYSATGVGQVPLKGTWLKY